MGSAGVATLDLPVAYASDPPEARGLRRDGIRLVVSHLDGRIEHLRFYELPRLLDPGDLIVVNASGTLNASLPAERAAGERVEVHVSTELPGNLWTVEVRRPTEAASRPIHAALAGETLRLPGGGGATLLAPYPFAGKLGDASRLWAAALDLPLPLVDYLERYGSPIRYEYVPRYWPGEYYQTVFAAEPGSAESPSAGRPFTRELVTKLLAFGISIVPLILHTGVSSLEDHEGPYEERYRVPRRTAEQVNQVHSAGHRVIAVGTTVVRALETVTDDRGVTHPGAGWTNLVIAPVSALRAVDGLLTGLHEPRATHLWMVQAVARRGGEVGLAAVDRAYREARERGYLWHEFGDAHLILP